MDGADAGGILVYTIIYIYTDEAARRRVKGVSMPIGVSVVSPLRGLWLKASLRVMLVWMYAGMSSASRRVVVKVCAEAEGLRRARVARSPFQAAQP